jgi:hypothetical protein
MFEITLLVEGAGFIDRILTRKSYYARARERASSLHRPLVVVGAPTSGLVRNYPCGDLCIDLEGCMACGSPPRDVEAPGGIPLDDDSAVVFVSYVFEYVDDIEAAWREVRRVAGHTDNCFVASVQTWATWTHLLYPGSRWIVEEAPPDSTEFAYRSLTRPPIDVRKLLVKHAEAG